jgi:hypothetical protein
MQPNPYESPPQPPPRKGSAGTSLIRIGGILAAIGVVVFIGCFIVVFCELFDGPQYWIQLLVLVSIALVPIGVVVASVGIVLWFIKLVKS